MNERRNICEISLCLIFQLPCLLYLRLSFSSIFIFLVRYGMDGSLPIYGIFTFYYIIHVEGVTMIKKLVLCVASSMLFLYPHVLDSLLNNVITIANRWTEKRFKIVQTFRSSSFCEWASLDVLWIRRRKTPRLMTNRRQFLIRLAENVEEYQEHDSESRENVCVYDVPFLGQ
jgi:hypothetical protein